MRRRRKHNRRPNKDQFRAGPSRVVPFVPTESAVDRHRRRFNVALTSEFLLQAWCSHRGLTLTITNNGHHWTFRRSGRTFAQWWPASAKVVLGFNWRGGIHCHDWIQVAKVLYQHLHQ